MQALEGGASLGRILDFAGGRPGFGESPEDAAIREVEEETGLRIEIKSIATIDSLFDTSGSEDFHGIRIIYHAEVIGGQLRHETSGSTDRCEWHPFHPAPDIDLVELSEVGIRIMRETVSSP